MISTTVKDLAKFLRGFPAETQVFISQDSEGNGFGTTSDQAYEYSPDDKAVILFPVRERLDFDEVMPKAWEKQSE